MSFHVFFDLSAGISSPMNIPKGVIDSVRLRISKTESALGIERETYNGEVRWNIWPLIKKEVSNEILCATAEEHNATVRWFYDILAESGEATEKTEVLTPEIAKEIWLGLRMINVIPAKWTDDYYRSQMDAIYECFRGRPSEGMTFDSDPLTESQAKDVIIMFSHWLDKGDIRLDVIKGHDQLSSGDEYFWCSGCGAVDYDEIEDFENDFCTTCQEKNDGV